MQNSPVPPSRSSRVLSLANELFGSCHWLTLSTPSLVLSPIDPEWKSHGITYKHPQSPNTYSHFLEVHSAASLLSCHTRHSPNVGFNGAFSCLSPPLLLLGTLHTEVTIPYHKLHLNGWMGVSSSTSLCISKLACLWVCIRYRWIVANFEASLPVSMYKMQVNCC